MKVGVFGMSGLMDAQGLVNKSTLVMSLGISSQAFDKWGVKPRSKRGRENFYSVGDVVQNRLDNAEKIQSKPGTKKGAKQSSKDQPDEDRLKLEKLSEEVRALKLKNDVSEAHLMPVEFVTSILAEIAGEQTAIFETLPLNIKRQNLDIPAHVLDMITRDVAKVTNIAATVGGRLDEIVTQLIDDAENKAK